MGRIEENGQPPLTILLTSTKWYRTETLKKESIISCSS